MIYKSKFYNNYFIRKCISLSIKIAHLFDGRKDHKICGCSLVQYVPSIYRETMGATGSESTCYWALDQIIGEMEFQKNDAFIDVGCGKGRVLAYLLNKNAPCTLTGIELNKDVAEYAHKWTERYDNVMIINGNAFDLDYNDYGVLFMGRPFETQTFHQFIDQLEETLKHPIKLIYWWDTQSGAYLENKSCWKLIKRGWVFRSHGLFMYHCPQRYSIWDYTPKEVK